MSVRHFRWRLPLAAAIALTLSACATHPVLFTSEPAGVSVTVDGYTAKTPCTLDLSYGRHEVSFAAEGQPPITIEPAQGRLAAVAAGAGAGVARVLRASGDIFMQVGEAGIDAVSESHPQTDDDYAAAFALLVVTIGFYGAGYVSRKAGETLNRAAERVAHVHVVFPGLEQAPPAR